MKGLFQTSVLKFIWAITYGHLGLQFVDSRHQDDNFTVVVLNFLGSHSMSGIVARNASLGR